MIDICKDPIEADVLIIGGGIAGLMAAINAADQGVSVTVVEKANTKRSGCGATGNDHFMCYLPEIHGDDLTPILTEYRNSQVGGFSDISLATVFLEQSFERVKDWDSWGISMKPKGNWDFSGHAFPGRPRIWLKYAGSNQKLVLTKEAKKRGVRIENHLPVTDLITDTDGSAIGAMGINIRNDEPVLTIFRAKSIILTTGCGSRLYPALTPGYMFNTANCPSCAGGSQAMAFRAGAKLVNMEFPQRHAGPKYFARCGKATWIGLYKDPAGKVVGPFVKKATREMGDITGDVWASVFTDMHTSGEGPVYMDCSSTSKEDFDYMMWGLVEEGNTGMLNYMADQGIDPRKHKIEFMQYEPFLCGRGIEIDMNAQSSIKGLYAAGDPVGNFRADIAGAATYGWIAGASAAQRAKEMDSFPVINGNKLVKEKGKLYSAFMEREIGADWREANLTLQQIMGDYAGVKVRSETLLTAGLKYLEDLRSEVTDTLKTANSHELMRALESIDLIDCGEAVLLAALERKETRQQHLRSDFPFTNPLLADKFLTIKQKDGETLLEWRDKQ